MLKITNSNFGQNICGLFYFLAQSIFTASEIKLNYYHQKVNVRVASQEIRKFQENPSGRVFVPTQEKKKTPEMLGFYGEYPTVHTKAKF